jgi:ABC-type taurine transport system substrate-binding protein
MEMLFSLHPSVLSLLRSLTYACESHNSDSLLGVPAEPRIIHVSQFIQDQHGVTTMLQHFLQK